MMQGFKPMGCFKYFAACRLYRLFGKSQTIRHKYNPSKAFIVCSPESQQPSRRACKVSVNVSCESVLSFQRHPCEKHEEWLGAIACKIEIKSRQNMCFIYRCLCESERFTSHLEKDWIFGWSLVSEMWFIPLEAGGRRKEQPDKLGICDIRSKMDT